MRLIEVEDPWFGQYLNVNLGGVWSGQTYALGPLTIRNVRRESLQNGGTVALTGGVREKPVLHSYMEGKVTGVIDSPPSVRVLRMGNDQFSASQYYYNNTVLKLWTVSQTLSQSGMGFTLTVRGTYVEWGYRNTPAGKKWVIVSRKSGGMSQAFSRNVDQYTQTVTYTKTGNITRWDDCTNGGITNRTCPYGTAGDNLGPRINDIRYWIDATLALPGNQFWYQPARNQAIWAAVDNMKVADINYLQDYNDVIRPIDSLKRLSTGLQAVSGWKSVLKKMANVHLFWSYVISTGILTAKETHKLMRFLRFGSRGVHSQLGQELVGHGSYDYVRDGDGYHTVDHYTAKVVCGGGWGPFGTIAQLQQTGLLPTVGDLWDMIPYSFVVDWLIPVQNTINSLSGLSCMVHLPLKHIVIGRKLTTTFHKTWYAGSHRFSVDCSVVRYERQIMRHFPSDLSLLETGFRDPRKHAVTAAALAVQATL